MKKSSPPIARSDSRKLTMMGGGDRQQSAPDDRRWGNLFLFPITLILPLFSSSNLQKKKSKYFDDLQSLPLPYITTMRPSLSPMIFNMAERCRHSGDPLSHFGDPLSLSHTWAHSLSFAIARVRMVK